MFATVLIPKYIVGNEVWVYKFSDNIVDVLDDQHTTPAIKGTINRIVIDGPDSEDINYCIAFREYDRPCVDTDEIDFKQEDVFDSEEECVAACKEYLKNRIEQYKKEMFRMISGWTHTLNEMQNAIDKEWDGR